MLAPEVTVRLVFMVVSLLGNLLWTSQATAKCADPMGCFWDICQYPGNVVEMTVLADSVEAIVVTVRVDAVHVVDAARFVTPAVGSELDISAWNISHHAGDMIVGLAGEPGKGWPLFGRDEFGDVRCITGNPIDHTITIAELEAVVRIGRCDGGDPLPDPLADCNDQPGDCSVAGVESVWSILALFIPLVVRGRRPRVRITTA